MSKHYLNEIGTLILLDVGIEVSNSLSQWIKYIKPNGVEGTWDCSLYGSYSELAALTGTYFISYVVAGTDINVAGEWALQAVVANTAGTWYGETVKETFYDEYQ